MLTFLKWFVLRYNNKIDNNHRVLLYDNNCLLSESNLKVYYLTFYQRSSYNNMRDNISI